MPNQCIRLTIDSRLDAVPLLGLLVNTLCSVAGLSPAERNLVEVCAVEAVNNVIEHAYRSEPDHELSLAVTIAPDRLILEVFDRGQPADPAVIHADHRQALEIHADHLSQVAETGRGLAIMQVVMDSLEYTTGGGGNCLRLTKRLQGTRRLAAHAGATGAGAH
jgi:serine/threonine-protein kinase RsbW